MAFAGFNAKDSTDQPSHDVSRFIAVGRGLVGTSFRIEPCGSQNVPARHASRLAPAVAIIPFCGMQLEKPHKMD